MKQWKEKFIQTHREVSMGQSTSGGGGSLQIEGSKSEGKQGTTLGKRKSTAYMETIYMWSCKSDWWHLLEFIVFIVGQSGESQHRTLPEKTKNAKVLVAWPKWQSICSKKKKLIDLHVSILQKCNWLMCADLAFCKIC
jgi:hypothetical protein